MSRNSSLRLMIRLMAAGEPKRFAPAGFLAIRCLTAFVGLLGGLLVGPHAQAADSQNHFTPLATIVVNALTNSGTLHAQKQAEIVSEAQIKVAQTGYYPTLSAQALDSTGFPGSTSATGVTGIVGSPYRSGLAYGVVASGTIYDFGGTNSNMDVAKKSFTAQKMRTRVGVWSVKQEAIDLYYACARARTQMNLWSEVEVDSKSVQKEVERFVHTGQRSVVDGLLAKAQTDESGRSKSSYAEQLNVLQKRLSVLTGLPTDAIVCPDLEAAQIAGDGNDDSPAILTTNPYIDQAEADRAVAVSQIDQARAGYMPKLIAVGSIGDMQDSRLVEKKDYSLGVGFVLPLFDGLRTPREVASARALRVQKEAEVNAAHQFVDDENLRFEQMIRSDQVAIGYLHQELKDSDQAFKVARKRYTAFSGSLVDVRESIRNYSRLRSDFIDIQSDWQRALTLKTAFNGQEI